MTDKIVVLNTCGSEDEATRVARAILEARLAACVNIVPGVRSLYHWQGALEESQEWLLVIKSRRPLLERLIAAIRKVHSYEVPEVIVVPVVDGWPPYLQWIDTETAPD